MPNATNVITLTVGDTKYDVDLFAITASEYVDAFMVTGYRSNDLLRAATQDFQIEAMAALIWLHRRRTETDLTYHDVASSLTLGSLVAEEELDAA